MGGGHRKPYGCYSPQADNDIVVVLPHNETKKRRRRHSWRRKAEHVQVLFKQTEAGPFARFLSHKRHGNQMAEGQKTGKKRRVKKEKTTNTIISFHGCEWWWKFSKPYRTWRRLRCAPHVHLPRLGRQPTRCVTTTLPFFCVFCNRIRFNLVETRASREKIGEQIRLAFLFVSFYAPNWCDAEPYVRRPFSGQADKGRAHSPKSQQSLPPFLATWNVCRILILLVRALKLISILQLSINFQVLNSYPMREIMSSLMTTKNRLSYHLRGNKFRSNSREREETENSQQDFFSSSLFQEAARIRSKECCLPPLASLRLVSHMITLLSSLVISLSERHLVSAKTAISSHRSSCLLCFKHFRSSVKRSSIDTRSVVWVPFHISPPVPIFISPQ